MLSCLGIGNNAAESFCSSSHCITTRPRSIPQWIATRSDTKRPFSQHAGLLLLIAVYTLAFVLGHTAASERDCQNGQCAAGASLQEKHMLEDDYTDFPTLHEVQRGSVVAVCVVSREIELPGLKIAVLTILQLQPQVRVQIFTFGYLEEALLEALGPMLAVAAPDGRVQVQRLWEAGQGHHDYGLLLKSRKFWLGCDGEMVLIFQADTLLCRGSDQRLEDFLPFDYIGAPFVPGACAPGHDKDKSMCQDDFDKMASAAALPIPTDGVGGNGGLSLRRRSKVLELIQACPDHPFITWNEDIFFSFPCANTSFSLPPEPLARRFSVETGVFYPQPFGVHKPWAYRSLEEMSQLVAACPELALTLPPM